MDLSPGLAQGLAQDLQFDQRINDARVAEERMQRAKDMAASQAKLFADDFSKAPTGSRYDDAIIKDYTRKRMQDAVNIIKANPNYKYSPDALAQLKAIKDDIKGNEHVQRAVTFVDAKNRLKQDLAEVAKNPQMHDQEAYQNIIQQVNNYDQYGNQNGQEAALKEGPKPFVYQKPQDFVDLPSTMLKAGNSIKNYDVKKGKNIGEYWTEPKQDEVNAIKNSIYQQHGRQIQVEARKLGLQTPEQVDKWISDNVAAGFNKHYSIGDANAAFNNAMRLKEYNLSAEKSHKTKGGAGEIDSYTTWDDFVNPKNKAGYVNQNVARKVWGDKPPIRISGNNGATVDLSGHDFNYDGRFVDVNGVKFLTGSVNLPLKIAEEKGIYKQGWFTKDGITSDFLDKAKLETGTNKDGKEEQYVKVDYALPVNSRDQTAKSMYEVNTMPSKLVESAVNLGADEIPTGTKQEWLNNGWTEDQIRQAVGQGKIRVK